MSGTGRNKKRKDMHMTEDGDGRGGLAGLEI